MDSDARLKELLGVQLPLFAVLDAAQDPGVLALLRLYESPFTSLYSGDSARSMASVAPYLVRLDGYPALLKALIQESSGHNWGFFFCGDGTLESWRHHWRQFLLTRMPDGRTLLFRFYDPRVLLPFLEGSTSEERRFMLNKVNRLWVERGQDWVLLVS